MSSVRIAVIQAGLGMPSSTSRLADVLQSALVEAIEASGQDTAVTRINVRDLAVEVTQALVSRVIPETVEKALGAVTSADILVAVTPTFNASYAGVFKSFFDLVEPKALEGTPVVLGATGGTTRHSLVIDMAMRPLFTYLRAMPVPTAVFASTEDFAARTSIRARAQLVAAEALALSNARRSVTSAPMKGESHGPTGE